MTRQAHWDRVYERNEPDKVSWYQRNPRVSVELIRAIEAPTTARVLDVGGGASSLVDYLLDAGYAEVGVLDIARESLAKARHRLGVRAEAVEWFVGDVTSFASPHVWDVWHDRAVYHFLTGAGDRAAYRDVLLKTVPDDGHVIIATFGPEGPQRCSGLDVVRYSAESLAAELGAGFRLVETRAEDHTTPGEAVQQFMFARFRREPVSQ